eukprot:TRINITY_DN34391_c0_g1_i1.p1 TRINITY_DN34391_c0_g1~~TRINITY_DN34391_c0_g1_i1.p1  ORF type:complete len:469 (-),score=59.77 TRINITY_DN34391_c0_g1_i1:53-1459(-)
MANVEDGKSVQAENVFLFVNARSGGRRGIKLLELPSPLEVEISPNRRVLLHVFDIAEGRKGEKPGFCQLKECCAYSVTRVAVAGGDGTILWAVEEARVTGIDVLRQVQFVIVPLGTGNDFSRFTGWGGSAPRMRRLLRNEFAGLAALVREWSSAKPLLHDIWNVDIQVDEGRGAIFINEAGKKSEQEAKHLQRCMHSYCSMGWDARAGMEQEKRRTNSRAGNLCNYGIQVCVKGLPCRRKVHIGDMVESLHHGISEEAQTVFRGYREQSRSMLPYCCCSHAEEESTDDQELDLTGETPSLVGNPEVLVVLNIPNCYAGLFRFWEGAHRLGVDAAINDRILDAKQDAGDGRLEVVTYDFLQAAQAYCGSALPPNMGASRVFSGAPLFLRFREDDEDDMDIHVQIDGEFYKLRNPEFLSIHRLFQIQVLHSTRSRAHLDNDSQETSDDSCDSANSGASEAEARTATRWSL